MHCEIIDRYFNVFFVKTQLKKKLEKFFWAPEFGRPNRSIPVYAYTGLPNGLNTSLMLLYIAVCIYNNQPVITCSKLIIETLEQDVKYVQS